MEIQSKNNETTDMSTDNSAIIDNVADDNSCKDNIVEELSYYEYMLTKNIWPAWNAINYLISYHLLKRSWTYSDDYNLVKSSYRNDIVQKLRFAGKKVFSKRTITKGGYDNHGEYEPSSLDIDQCDVYPKPFLQWAHNHQFDLPYEFRLFIGIEDIEVKLTQRMEGNIDKAVCQGIAKLLWDQNPSMKIEEMLDHYAIRVYGGGRSHDRDTTVRRWLSEVDPRLKKTGPKKKP